jgi:hypothetical protein
MSITASTILESLFALCEGLVADLATVAVPAPATGETLAAEAPSSRVASGEEGFL